MTKSNVKAILHWLLLVACIGGAAYIGFVATGLSVGERIALAATTLGGLITTTLTRLLPALDVAVDKAFGDEAKPPTVPPAAAALLALVGALALSSAATAQPSPQALGCVDKAGTYCVVPATAVGWQINLKNGETGNGVVLVGLTLQHEFGTLPVGFGLYAGLGASTDNQGSYQGCVGLSITNWGMVCGGFQRASFAGGGTSLQGMLTFAGQLTFGGNPSYLKQTASAGKLTPQDF